MRHCFLQSGIFTRRSLGGKGQAGNATVKSAVRNNQYSNFIPSKRHLRTTSCQTFHDASRNGRNLSNKPGFPSLSSAFFSNRPDPFARRPTSKCDPYGQSGKPLTLDEVLGLATTVEPQWKVMMTHNDRDDDETDIDNDQKAIPFAIRRVYWHDDYLQGAQFSTHVAAVAQMNAQHFPHEVILSRKLESKTKTWKICTEIVCRTHVLQGLSHHDFYLATLIDIEAQRPEVRGLLSSNEQ